MTTPTLPTNDVLVPDTEVCRELGISSMTVHRYDCDERMIALGWPPKIKMRQRNYRSRRALEAFKAGLVQRAIEQRRQLMEPAGEAA